MSKGKPLPAFFGKKSGDKSKGPMASALAGFKKKGAFKTKKKGR